MNRRTFILTAVLTAAIGCFASLTHADAGFVVIVNVSNPVTTLSSSDLKKALTGNTKQWANGAVVQIGITSSETPELKFLAESAGMTATELLARVQQQVFKGEMRKPVIVRSLAECVGLARSNPGAICVTAGGVALPPETKAVGIR